MSVPPRWRNCPRKGKLIADKFLPFKTPLSEEYNRDLAEDQVFPPSMLVDYMESCGRRMGLVVDLTKTDRYYDKRELLKAGIGHHKLICEGYGSAPNTEQVQSFRTLCKQFFIDHPGEIVGVHCTHGFNRTGFLISAYLVEEECWDLEAAVATFSLLRPPGIYKGQYLQELANRYMGGDIGEMTTPPLPDWCNEEEENSGGEDGKGRPKGKEKAGKGEPNNKKKRSEIENENSKFAVSVDNVEVIWGPLRQDIQVTCQKILNWESSGFPGCQPVSMDVQNIRFLHEKPYRVSWKADGTRYLLYIRDKGQIYLIDRDNSVFSAPGVAFPSRKRPGEHLKECLADSELVIDKVQRVDRPRLLIYDMIQFEGNKDVSLCDHQRRLLCIEKELIQPREDAAKVGVLDKIKEPFSIRAKQFWDLSETRMLLEKFIPGLTHESDGLIFNPSSEHYVAGQCEHLLKWKPHELNSVDFRLNIITKRQEGMLPERIGQLFVGSGHSTVMFSELDLKLNKEARQYHGRIIECTFNNNKWNFLRVRDDKSYPNSFNTAKSVCDSIRQPVTKEWLLEVCEKHRWRAHSEGSGAMKRQSSEPSDSMPPPKIPPR